MVLAGIQPVLLDLGQMTVMPRHIARFLTLNAGLTPFEIGSLVRIQGAVVDAVRNPLLLIRFPAVYLVHPWMSRIDNSGARARG